MATLKWMMETKGIPSGQRKGSGCVDHKPTKVLRLSRVTRKSISQAGHAESASEAGCWLKT